MPLHATVYCSIADVQRFLSSQAVSDFADHDGDGIADDDVVEDCINEATDEINGSCLQQYTKTVLEGQAQVNAWCKKMAARFLCERRGNPVPDSLEREFERIAGPGGFLDRVSRNRYQIADAPKRRELVPTVSNLKVDRRFRYSKLRVIRPTSSKAATLRTQDKNVDGPTPWD